MAATLPMAVYGLEVPAGDVAISARPDIPAAFRITMAAIDPSAEAEGDGPVRATLKIIREPLIMDDDESDFDEDEMNAMLASDDEDDEESEEDEAGPSDPAKSKAARKAAAAKQLREELAAEMEVDGEDDDEDDEDDEDDMDFDEPEEFVICTLDPTKQYQQPLDITIGDDERVWFKVSGTHTIYSTGNYVEPANPPHDHDHDDYDEEDYDEDEYDLSPDEDELDDSEDELDDMENPRVTEVESEEEAPKLVKADKKGKKRAAEESGDDATSDDSMAASATNGEKSSKKQQKKLKTNEGKAVETKKEEPASAKSDKKVQFAKESEQGPTPSPAAAKKGDAALGVKTVQGVTIDDKKLGTGPAAKKGNRIGMRYIGKLQKDGKVFDSNKKGKPFSFKLGAGEVIKGWDIGVAGIAVGGERRITIPAHLAYGSQKIPGIPPNSTSVFDIKCVEIK